MIDSWLADCSGRWRYSNWTEKKELRVAKATAWCNCLSVGDLLWSGPRQGRECVDQSWLWKHWLEIELIEEEDWLGLVCRQINLNGADIHWLTWTNSSYDIDGCLRAVMATQCKLVVKVHGADVVVVSTGVYCAREMWISWMEFHLVRTNYFVGKINRTLGECPIFSEGDLFRYPQRTT